MQVNFKEIFAGPVFKYSAYNEGPAQRIKNATIIIREFLRAGYPLGIALAAVTNAQHESGLSNQAMGDKNASGRRESVGLFQLRWSDNDRGAGVGMSDKQRMNPVLNTKRIIKEVKDYGNRGLFAAYDNGATLGELAIIFGRDIERPANRGVGRDKTAYKIFGNLANQPANQLTKAVGIALGVGLLSLPLLVGGGVLLVALGYAVFRKG